MDDFGKPTGSMAIARFLRKEGRLVAGRLDDRRLHDIEITFRIADHTQAKRD